MQPDMMRRFVAYLKILGLSQMRIKLYFIFRPNPFFRKDNAKATIGTFEIVQMLIIFTSRVDAYKIMHEKKRRHGRLAMAGALAQIGC